MNNKKNSKLLQLFRKLLIGEFTLCFVIVLILCVTSLIKPNNTFAYGGALIEGDETFDFDAYSKSYPLHSIDTSSGVEAYTAYHAYSTFANNIYSQLGNRDDFIKQLPKGEIILKSGCTAEITKKWAKKDDNTYEDRGSVSSDDFKNEMAQNRTGLIINQGQIPVWDHMNDRTNGKEKYAKMSSNELIEADKEFDSKLKWEDHYSDGTPVSDLTFGVAIKVIVFCNECQPHEFTNDSYEEACKKCYWEGTVTYFTDIITPKQLNASGEPKCGDSIDYLEIVEGTDSVRIPYGDPNSIYPGAGNTMFKLLDGALLGDGNIRYDSIKINLSSDIKEKNKIGHEWRLNDSIQGQKSVQDPNLENMILPMTFWNYSATSSFDVEVWKQIYDGVEDNKEKKKANPNFAPKFDNSLLPSTVYFNNSRFVYLKCANCSSEEYYNMPGKGTLMPATCVNGAWYYISSFYSAHEIYLFYKNKNGGSELEEHKNDYIGTCMIKNCYPYELSVFVLLDYFSDWIRDDGNNANNIANVNKLKGRYETLCAEDKRDNNASWDELFKFIKNGNLITEDSEHELGYIPRGHEWVKDDNSGINGWTFSNKSDAGYQGTLFVKCDRQHCQRLSGWQDNFEYLNKYTNATGTITVDAVLEDSQTPATCTKAGSLSYVTENVFDPNNESFNIFKNTVGPQKDDKYYGKYYDEYVFTTDDHQPVKFNYESGSAVWQEGEYIGRMQSTATSLPTGHNWRLIEGKIENQTIPDSQLQGEKIKERILKGTDNNIGGNGDKKYNNENLTIRFADNEEYQNAEFLFDDEKGTIWVRAGDNTYAVMVFVCMNDNNHFLAVSFKIDKENSAEFTQTPADHHKAAIDLYKKRIRYAALRYGPDETFEEQDDNNSFKATKYDNFQNSSTGTEITAEYPEENGNPVAHQWEINTDYDGDGYEWTVSTAEQKDNEPRVIKVTVYFVCSCEDTFSVSIDYSDGKGTINGETFADKKVETTDKIVRDQFKANHYQEGYDNYYVLFSLDYIKENSGGIARSFDDYSDIVSSSDGTKLKEQNVFSTSTIPYLGHTWTIDNTYSSEGYQNGIKWEATQYKNIEENKKYATHYKVYVRLKCTKEGCTHTPITLEKELEGDDSDPDCDHARTVKFNFTFTISNLEDCLSVEDQAIEGLITENDTLENDVVVTKEDVYSEENAHLYNEYSDPALGHNWELDTNYDGDGYEWKSAYIVDGIDFYLVVHFICKEKHNGHVCNATAQFVVQNTDEIKRNTLGLIYKDVQAATCNINGKITYWGVLIIPDNFANKKDWESYDQEGKDRLTSKDKFIGYDEDKGNFEYTGYKYMNNYPVSGADALNHNWTLYNDLDSDTMKSIWDTIKGLKEEDSNKAILQNGWIWIPKETKGYDSYIILKCINDSNHLVAVKVENSDGNHFDPTCTLGEYTEYIASIDINTFTKILKNGITSAFNDYGEFTIEESSFSEIQKDTAILTSIYKDVTGGSQPLGHSWVIDTTVIGDTDSDGWTWEFDEEGNAISATFHIICEHLNCNLQQSFEVKDEEFKTYITHFVTERDCENDAQDKYIAEKQIELDLKFDKSSFPEGYDQTMNDYQKITNKIHPTVGNETMEYTLHGEIIVPKVDEDSLALGHDWTIDEEFGQHGFEWVNTGGDNFRVVIYLKCEREKCNQKESITFVTNLDRKTEVKREIQRATCEVGGFNTYTASGITPENLGLIRDEIIVTPDYAGHLRRNDSFEKIRNYKCQHDEKSEDETFIDGVKVHRESNVTNPLGHHWIIDTTTEEDTDNDGWTWRSDYKEAYLHIKCTNADCNCSAKITITDDSIVEDQIAPDCLTNGFKTYTADLNKETIISQLQSKYSVKPNEEYDNYADLNLSTDLSTITCTINVVDEENPPMGHKWNFDDSYQGKIKKDGSSDATVDENINVGTLWEWNSDLSTYCVTFYLKCEREKCNNTTSLVVDAVKDIKAAKCDENGSITYTAEVLASNSGKETLKTTYTETITALGHRWIVDKTKGDNGFTWNDEFDFNNGLPNATIHFRCENNCGKEHSLSVSDVKVDQSQDMNCDTPAYKEYKATFTRPIDEGYNHYDLVDETIESNLHHVEDPNENIKGHSWDLDESKGIHGFEWIDQGNEHHVRVYFKCTVDDCGKTESILITTGVKVTLQASSCTQDGINVYQVSGIETSNLKALIEEMSNIKETNFTLHDNFDSLDNHKCTGEHYENYIEDFQDGVKTHTVHVKNAPGHSWTRDTGITGNEANNKTGFKFEKATDGIYAVLYLECATCHAKATVKKKLVGEGTTHLATCTTDYYVEYNVTFSIEEDIRGKLVFDIEGNISIDADSFTLNDVDLTATFNDVTEGTAKGHKYGNPTVTWSSDPLTATATYTCLNECGHTETISVTTTLNEDGQITSEITEEATCTQQAVRTYTAKFLYDPNGEIKTFTATQTVKEGSLALHTWTTDASKDSTDGKNDGWIWDSNGSYATVYLVCKVCGEATTTATATQSALEDDPNKIVIDDSRKAPTCDEEGFISYKATVIVDGQSFTSELELDKIPALGHEWYVDTSKGAKEDGFIWTQDPITGEVSAVLVLKCHRDKCGQTLEIPAQIDSDPVVKVERSCEQDEIKTYVATVSPKSARGNNDQYFTNETEVSTMDFATPNSALKHEWNIDSSVWSLDSSTVTVTFKCNKCNSTVIKTVTKDDITSTVLEGNEATCTADGLRTYTAKVTDPDEKEYTLTNEVTIEKLGHEWNNEPTWEWDGVTKATATFTCSRCGTYTETKEATGEDITNVVTIAPLCEAAGLMTYTAKVIGPNNNEYYGQTTEEIPMLKHKWSSEIIWTWTYDLETNSYFASATVLCQNDITHSHTYQSKNNEVTIVGHVEVEAGCTTTGVYRYTATVHITELEEDFTNELDVLIDATNHTWLAPTWEFSEDYTKATATFTCSKCEQTKEITVDTEAENITASCLKGEGVLYTASVSFDEYASGDIQTATLEVITGEALGHNFIVDENYGDKTGWEWSEDSDGHVSATLHVICSRCGENHVLEGTVEFEVVEKATCTDKGTGNYTAHVTLDDGVYENVEDTSLGGLRPIPVLGHHLVGEATFRWEEDKNGYKAYATFHCDRCEKDIEVEANVTKSIATQDCETANDVTYTATAINDEYEVYTEKKVIEGVALGHTWETTPSYKEKDGKHYHVYICEVCGKTKEEECDGIEEAIVVFVKEATCTEQGYTVYRCTKCNHEYQDSFVDMISHSYQAKHTVRDGVDYHQNVCSVCGHIEEGSLEECDELGKTTFVLPSCVSGGYTSYECSVCHTEHRRNFVSALGHDYETSWEWKDNNMAATVTITCSRCDLHVEISAYVTAVDGNRIEVVTNPATCVKEGRAIYTAYVTYNGQLFTDTTVETLPMTGHSYNDPIITWDESHENVTFLFKCNNCDDEQTKITKATINTTEATCTANGNIHYSASVTFEEKVYEAEYDEVIPMLGHTYGEPTWEWNEDFTVATATFTCSKCSDTKQVVANSLGVGGNVITVKEDTKQTCEVDGKIIYTATVTFLDTVYTNSQEKVLPKLGHSYNDPIITWDESHENVTFLFKCNNCDDEQTKTSKATINTTEATCTANGNIHYSASVTFEEKVYEAEYDEVIPMLGHTYGEPTWEWNEDFTVATATFTCTTCGDVQVCEASIEETIDENNNTVYKAIVIFNQETYQDQKIIEAEMELGLTLTFMAIEFVSIIVFASILGVRLKKKKKQEGPKEE